MYLNVILTIFVIIQIITIVLIYKWWNKYGRNIVNSFLEIKKGGQGQMGDFNLLNLYSQKPDMGEIMKQFANISKIMGKK
jgi:hypothetical protein